MDKIMEVQGLKKSYGGIRAVQGIDFYVERGKLFAFLGPNGAGKSTTIDIICTFLKPDGGTVRIDDWVLGQDDEEIRNIIGVVFQDSLLDALLTVRENLQIRGSFYGLKGQELKGAILAAANTSGVEGFIDRPYGKLSGGQRRRADIARALINTPEILFLDEPTTGLDPQTRQNVWKTIRALQKETGMTIFLTTHYMEEAAEADYVVVMDEGMIAAKGTPSELKEQYSTDILRMTATDTGTLCRKLENLHYIYQVAADQVIVEIPKTMDALLIIDQCRQLLSGFEVLRGTMDDAFITITGKECRE